ncbi:MAG: cation:proton antiporter [Bacteroidaceae bacterium]|nr:cation:proton antiporter [Bacteroidaceae bacterium]
MGELQPLISDLALILVLAGVVTILFKRLNQPLVLGYIVAGFISSPHFQFMPSVTDMQSVQTWADIGVIFLMFTLGLEFSFKKILKMGSSPFIAACTIIFCMIGLGSICGHFFGWSRINSLFLGGMLAMSSTTIIFKAFDDMGLRQQRFASSVLSVLVVEDILGILLMVILAMVAAAGQLEGAALANSMLRLVLVLVVWFLVGLFIIPTFLRKNRKWMSRETLLIVSLGLCFLMVVLAVKMNYSAAFGAFMMGSILAETVEAEQIEGVVAPVKDFFGAVFFVSVGMLVDPQILAQYWLPILVLVLTIIVGQVIFGTGGYLLSGQPLKVAMQCGFSMAQIGEFAFIIASLGVSLKVTADFLYPVVVAVSVITTFLTPYMIRLAIPAYNRIEPILPARLKQTLDDSNGIPSVSNDNAWKRLLLMLLKQVGAYAFLSIAVIAVMFASVLPLLTSFLGQWWGRAACGVLTLLIISPFLRAIVMRKNHSDEFKALWQRNRFNRFPLLFTVLVRYVLSSAFIFNVIHYLFSFSAVAQWIVSFVLMLVIIASRRVKLNSVRLEHLFLRNLHSREIQAEQQGRTAPGYAQRLLSRDIHLSILTLPMNTRLAGQTLFSLDLARKDGVMVAAIIREGARINIPGGNMRLFPGDKLQVIGDDEHLSAFARRLQTEINTAYERTDDHEMLLRSLTIDASLPFCNKTVRESRLREDYQCMLVGFEDGEEHLGLPHADRLIREGDVIWIVGERASLQSLTSQI